MPSYTHYSHIYRSNPRRHRNYTYSHPKRYSTVHHLHFHRMEAGEGGKGEGGRGEGGRGEAYEDSKA
jgi:hypothetical protein